MYDYCCDQQSQGCQAKGTCDSKCNQLVQDRIRHLASDVGFYYEFDFDWDGIPVGCPGFKSVKDNNRWGWYFAERAPEPPMCPKQTMKEGLNSEGKPEGKAIWETVEEYADDIDVWLKDFVSTWKKMSQNGIIHTGAKILHLSKNSQFGNHNFHKIHIFKISFFTKFII